jgi:hypothetical protein
LGDSSEGGVVYNWETYWSFLRQGRKSFSQLLDLLGTIRSGTLTTKTRISVLSFHCGKMRQLNPTLRWSRILAGITYMKFWKVRFLKLHTSCIRSVVEAIGKAQG